MKNYQPSMKYQFIDFERQTSVKSYYNGCIKESRVINCQIEDIFKSVYGNEKQGFMIVIQDLCDKQNPFICAKVSVIIKQLHFNGKQRNCVLIQDLNVKKSHRRLGLAKKLCNQVEICLKENNIDADLISVEIPNSQGFISQFFKEMGFQNVLQSRQGTFSRWKKVIDSQDPKIDYKKFEEKEGLQVEQIVVNQENSSQIKKIMNQFISMNPPHNFQPDLIKEYKENPNSKGFYVFKSKSGEILGILKLLKDSQQYSILPTSFIGLRFGLFKDKKHYYWSRWLLTIIMASIFVILFILQGVIYNIDNEYVNYLKGLNVFNFKFIGIYFSICALINLKFFLELKKLMNKYNPCLNIAMLHVQGKDVQNTAQKILQFAELKGKELGCGSMTHPVDLQNQIMINSMKKNGFKEFPMRQNCVIQRKIIYKDLKEDKEEVEQQYWGNFFIDIRDL